MYFVFFRRKGLFLMFLLTGGGGVLAQTMTDTVFIVPDVVVTASRNQYFGNDIRTDTFSAGELRSWSGESLGRFLSGNTALNIKAYGAGGALSSLALRGTTSSHVQVNWNGFPINSVTLGSTDFSMIPAAGFSQVSLVYGASGALYGSGTFGGAVNLDSGLKPGKAYRGSASLSYHSLKSLSGSLSYQTGNERAACSVNAWGAFSGNEFSYFDYIRQQKRTQNDGDWQDAGLIQHAAFRLGRKSKLETGAWIQAKTFQIPSRIGSTTFEFQKDRSLRFYSAFQTHGDQWGLQVKAARFSDHQEYWQKPSAQTTVRSIESVISSVQWYGDAEFRYFFLPCFSVDAGLTTTLLSADVSAYGEEKTERGIAFFAGAKYSGSRITLQSAFRRDFNSHYTSGILPSGGVFWKVIPGIWTLRANISGKFRKPTFNDLYWIPGGNTALHPEKGYSLETGTVVSLISTRKITLSVDESVYFSRIRDMIVWQPAGIYWEAGNFQQVRALGLESKLMFDALFPGSSFHSSVMVTLNRSLYHSTSGAEKVMLYSPRVITAWENRFETGIWTFSLWHHFTADRFYDDNALLSPFQTVDVQAGVNIPAGKQLLNVQLALYNLNGTAYELIRLYPMPGRYWSVKMNWLF